MSRGFGIYIHIPFCVRKCPYCDFVSGSAGQEERASYLKALQSELRSSEWKGRDARTIYFGGGTPSELDPGDLRAIMESVGEAFKVVPGAECSIECNPGTLDPAKLAEMRSMGFNRLSLGVQSFSDRFLRLLGRIHTSDEALEAYRLIREAGFDDLNLDLIFGLPGQTLADWTEDLRGALELRPEHLSLYNLTIEPETEFGRLKERGELFEVDEELAARMYETAAQLTAATGYGHYEISNFAIPGKECCHNLFYWRNEEYLGFGVGAASYVDGVRFSNVKDTREYIRAVSAGGTVAGYTERLDPRAALGEEIMLRLRLAEGFSVSELRRKYRLDPEVLYGDTLLLYLADGLLTRDAGSIRLTPHGRLLASEVCCRFL